MATEATARVNWTRPQTVAALHIYLQLSFGQLHQRNPKLIQLAHWIGRTPGAIALKLVNLASLDPVIVASGRSGMGNASALDRQIWDELQGNWDTVALAAAAEYEHLAQSNGLQADQDLLEEAQASVDVSPLEEGRTRSATVQVQNEKLVIASHIVPWSTDTKNRLNPQNGLCLSALHDRAYDQGLITVLPDFTVRVSPQLRAKPSDSYISESLLRFDRQPIRSPERFGPTPAFLEWHARRFGFLV